MIRLGVDVGGTFTDLVLTDDNSGAIHVNKVPTTPEDPSIGTMDGALELCELAGVSPADVEQFFHGTTIATNIVLEHNGARAGLLTTAGYRDILHIARHKRPYNFSLQQDLPWQKYPLVRRRYRLPIRERILAPDGDIQTPLEEEDVVEAVRKLRKAEVEAISVCFMFAFLNPEHEIRAGEIVRREWPDVYLSLSHRVIPQYREYERFSTTCLNSYVGPRTARYIANLDRAMKDKRFRAELHLMQTNGGVATAQGAVERPVTLLMSGPVAGLIGGIWASSQSGYGNVITLDVGGTSADIGVAPDGKMSMKHLLDTKIGDYQAMVPMVDIDTIGAGGGSIAYVDRGGVFRVGPKSAGAAPGPVLLRPRRRAADLDRLQRGARAPQSRQLPRRPHGAQGRPLQEGDRAASVPAARHERRGGGPRRHQDPQPRDDPVDRDEQRAQGLRPRASSPSSRSAGPGRWRPARVAAELAIPMVIVPPNPGLTSALGLLATDLSYDYSRTQIQILSKARSGQDRGGLRPSRRPRRGAARAGPHRRRRPDVHPHRRMPLPGAGLRAAGRRAPTARSTTDLWPG